MRGHLRLLLSEACKTTGGMLLGGVSGCRGTNRGLITEERDAQKAQKIRDFCEDKRAREAFTDL